MKLSHESSSVGRIFHLLLAWTYPVVNLVPPAKLGPPLPKATTESEEADRGAGTPWILEQHLHISPRLDARAEQRSVVVFFFSSRKPS